MVGFFHRPTDFIPVKRRSFLATVSAAGSVSIAGCGRSGSPTAQSLVPYVDGASSAWRTPLATVRHNLYNAGTTVPDTAPSLQWETTDLEEYSPAAVVADGQVYVGELHLDGPERLALASYDLATGEKLWSRPEVTRPPTVAGGGVYGAGPETVYGLARDGTVRWRQSVDTVGSFVAASETGFAVANGTGAVRAFHLRSGEPVWRTDGDYRATAATLTDDCFVFVDESGTVTALARSDGDQRWRTSIEAAERRRLAVADGSVFATGGYEIDAESGEIIEEFGWWNAPAFTDRLRLSWSTGLEASAGGERLWTRADPRGAYPAMADGTVVVVDYDSVLAIDALTGETNWEVPVGDSLVWPVVADDCILVQGAEGYLGMLQ